MNKRERNKVTAQKLGEFMEEIAEKQSDGNPEEKKKGKMDESTGIRFEAGSEDEEEYDPDWFKSKLESKKRPQDIEIYSVDDYMTIYGNSSQNEPKQKGGRSTDKRRDSK